eukprot:3731766-Rhodomonas_salina.1
MKECVRISSVVRALGRARSELALFVSVLGGATHDDEADEADVPVVLRNDLEQGVQIPCHLPHQNRVTSPVIATSSRFHRRGTNTSSQA